MGRQKIMATNISAVDAHGFLNSFLWPSRPSPSVWYTAQEVHGTALRSLNDAQVYAKQAERQMCTLICLLKDKQQNLGRPDQDAPTLDKMEDRVPNISSPVTLTAELACTIAPGIS